MKHLNLKTFLALGFSTALLFTSSRGTAFDEVQPFSEDVRVIAQSEQPTLDLPSRHQTFQTPEGPKTIEYSMVDGIPIVEGDIELDFTKLAERAQHFSSASWQRDPSAWQVVQSSFGTSHHGLAVTTDRSRLWPRAVVPYALDVSVDARLERRIRETMARIERKTPIRFLPQTTENDYVIFKQGNLPPGVVGRSPVGRQGGRQSIKLISSCPNRTITHEIGHAIGLFHEHNRQDRDRYIAINWERVEDRSDYKKYSENSFLFWGSEDGMDFGPYDYRSIMHYRSSAIFRNDGGDHSDLGVGSGDGDFSELDQVGLRAVYCPLINNDPARCTPYVEPASRPIFYPEMVLDVSPSQDLGTVEMGRDYTVSNAITIRNRIMDEASGFYRLREDERVERDGDVYFYYNEGLLAPLAELYPITVVITTDSPELQLINPESPPLLMCDDVDDCRNRHYFILEPNDSITLGATFTPRGPADREAAIQVQVFGFGREGNIENNGRLIFSADGYTFRSIRGRVANPLLSVIPERLILNNVSRFRQSFLIQNAGHDPLTVTGMEVEETPGHQSFHLVHFDAGPPPFTLQPGQASQGTIEYRPTDASQHHEGQIRLRSNGGDSVIPLSGIVLQR